MSETAVDFRSVTKNFGQVTALDGLDLTVRRGDVVALPAPPVRGNGAQLSVIGNPKTGARNRWEAARVATDNGWP
jgi:ABC-type branched-subunit amino acid transport system ATPase component